MPINITITTAGRAALVNAANTGTAPVTITQVGLSQTAVVPAVGTTALPGELKRIAGVAGEVVSADTIHINMTDDSADAYSLRSFALYLANGTLFGIYGQADPLIVKTAGSIAALAIDTIFADINAALLTFGDANFTNPPATIDRSGVIELATVAEAQSGIDALRALTPATAKAAILGWLLSQDGSGSGLDADLLDGQDGAYYANIAARLGFTPVNRAGDIMEGLLKLSGSPTDNLHAAPKSYVDALVTAAALLAKILTVDGSGSGLDADLLDGQNGSFYSDIIARLGFTPLNKAGDTSTGDLKVVADLWSYRTGGTIGILQLNAAGSRYLLNNGSAYVMPGQDLFVNSGLAWTAGNDGSGSGLDADLLDGLQASAFAILANFIGTNQSRTTSGFQKLPGGVIIQWGQSAHVDNTGSQLVTFPTPFPTAGFVGFASNVAVAAPSAFHATGNLTASNMRVYSSTASDLPAAAGTAFSYFVIGH